MSESGIVSAGQGRIAAARGSVMAFKAVAAQTGGDFSLMENPAGPEEERDLMARYCMEPG